MISGTSCRRELVRGARACLQAIALMTAVVTQAPAHEPARHPEHDLATFKQWVTDNLYCRGDFMTQVQTPEFLRQVKALGVEVETSWQEGDTPDGDFVLPQPVQIAGYAATRIHYWGDSGAGFYAEVAAPADVLARALKTKPIPKRLNEEFESGTVGITFIRAVRSDERLAPAIYVRASDTPGVSEVGCRYFDG
jgi:hypothetical protein